MAHIVKREGPRGTKYLVRYRDPAGKVRNATFKTKKSAEAFQRTTEVDMLRKTWVDPSAGSTTFIEYSATWIQTRRLRPRTIELYRSLIDRHLEPTFGEIPISDITPSMVRTWNAALAKRHEVTAAKAYRLLRAVLNTAVEDELIIRNPCVIKGAGIERSPERPVASPEQVWELAEAIETRFRVLVLSAGFLGLRWGELAGLSRRHVNLLHGTVTVDRQLVEDKHGKTSFGPPKTDAGRRTVKIPAVLVPELEAHLGLYAGEGVDGLVFVGAKGALLTRRNFHTKWNAARRQVDVADTFTFHDLRHSAKTLAAATGASTRELMHRMGHSSPAAALRYQHATQDRDKAIAEALSDVFDANRPRANRAQIADSVVGRDARNVG